MNPITNAKNLNKLNERELSLGLTGTKTSWHKLYEGSAWIFVGGLAFDLTEGDVLAVFSQYGEIVNINLVRDKKTGKTKGYCFICFEDQRSTNLAVDNLNGTKLLNRILRVDHVEGYREPKEFGDEDEVTKHVRAVGCGPEVQSALESRTRSPEEKAEKKKSKKTKIKKEFPDSDGEGTSRREKTSTSHRTKEVKREVSSDDDETSKRSRRKMSKPQLAADSDNETSSNSVKVKEEPVDRGYEECERRERPEENQTRRDDHYLKLDSRSADCSRQPRGKAYVGAGDGPDRRHQRDEDHERRRDNSHERRNDKSHHDRYHRVEREKETSDRRQDDVNKRHQDTTSKDRRLRRHSDDEDTAIRPEETSKHREMERKRDDEDTKHRDHRYADRREHDSKKKKVPTATLR